VSSLYTITGRLGQEPKLSITDSGTSVTRFSVAVEHRRQKNGEWTSETVWHDVVCFGDLAEHVAESLDRGVEVIVTGRIEEPRTYEKKDGGTGVSLPMVASEVAVSLRWATVQIFTAQKKAKTEEAF
jgi:single-strand DNA-binding protein